MVYLILEPVLDIPLLMIEFGESAIR